MPGSERIRDSVRLHPTLEKHWRALRPIAGICAAPAARVPRARDARFTKRRVSGAAPPSRVPHDAGPLRAQGLLGGHRGDVAPRVRGRDRRQPRGDGSARLPRRAPRARGGGGDGRARGRYVDGRVIWDANVITSRGPGTALEWSLCCVEALFGKEKAIEVAGPMVVQPPVASARRPFEWRLERDAGGGSRVDKVLAGLAPAEVPGDS